jgi:hypothetical protein
MPTFYKHGSLNVCDNGKMAVFWVVTPCSLVEVHQRFRSPCCLHRQGIVLMMEAIFQVNRVSDDENCLFRNAEMMKVSVQQ